MCLSVSVCLPVGLCLSVCLSVCLSLPISLSRCSSCRNYQLRLPRPRIDIFKTSISFSGALLWNSLPLSVRSSSKIFVHTLKQLHRINFDRILLERETETETGTERQKDRDTDTDTDRQTDRQTMRFSSDCHCNDWSFEAYFIHP